MCQVCSPFCGKCKPPMEKPAQCQICFTFNKPENRICKKCGADMPKRITPKNGPSLCRYTDTICQTLCSLSAIVPKNGVAVRCAKDRKLNKHKKSPSVPNSQ